MQAYVTPAWTSEAILEGWQVGIFAIDWITVITTVLATAASVLASQR